MAYIGSKRLLDLTSKGDSCFIRYSANADGTDFTEKRSAGQNYIGFATGQTAPTDKTDYEWIAVGETGADTRFTDEQVDALIALLDNIYDGSVTFE